MKSLTPIFEVMKTSNSPKLTWTEIYEDYLWKLVKEHHGKPWKFISRLMCENFQSNLFTAKRCREKWHNCMNPDTDKSFLTEVEELLLIAYHNKVKNNWAFASNFISHRNSSKLKNNFSSIMKKVSRMIYCGTVESSINVFSYIQRLYASYLIIDLFTTMNGNTDSAPTTIPGHIFNYITKIGINIELCRTFIARLTDTFGKTLKNPLDLSKLSNHIYLTKFFDIILNDIRIWNSNKIGRASCRERVYVLV